MQGGIAWHLAKSAVFHVKEPVLMLSSLPLLPSLSLTVAAGCGSELLGPSALARSELVVVASRRDSPGSVDRDPDQNLHLSVAPRPLSFFLPPFASPPYPFFLLHTPLLFLIYSSSHGRLLRLFTLARWCAPAHRPATHHRYAVPVTSPTCPILIIFEPDRCWNCCAPVVGDSRWYARCNWLGR